METVPSFFDCEEGGCESSGNSMGAWVNNIFPSCVMSILPKDWKGTRKFLSEFWWPYSCFSSYCFFSSSYDTSVKAKRRTQVRRVLRDIGVWIFWVEATCLQICANFKYFSRFSTCYIICMLTACVFNISFLLVEPSLSPNWCCFISCSPRGDQLATSCRGSTVNTQR